MDQRGMVGAGGYQFYSVVSIDVAEIGRCNFLSRPEEYLHGEELSEGERASTAFSAATWLVVNAKNMRRLAGRPASFMVARTMPAKFYG